MSRLARDLARGAALLLVLGGLSVGVASTASAACGPLNPCTDESGGATSQEGPRSDGTETASYSSAPSPSQPVVSCTVYANGNGLGNYCVSSDKPSPTSLRERFGGQELQRCRYSALPDGIPVPFNARPDEGRYLLMKCLDHINLDTPGGGPRKTLQMFPVFVPHGTGTADVENGISEYMWGLMENRASLMPVPFMVTRPNPVPVVGVPTYFTFRWIDPRSGTVRAMGPYADEPNGGPFVELRSNGLLMRAQATRITIDPNQKGIDAVVCDPTASYLPGAAPQDQPASACSITFPRSSASADEYATAPLPPHVVDAFSVSVDVEWRITYGQEGDMRELGDGFTMRLRQVLPVQEVQAPNQPPTVIY